MAITDELGMSSTPASNTTLGPSITLDGAVMTPSQVDDAFREEMSQRAKAITRHVAKGAGTYTAARADYNQFWRCTGAVTINLSTAATLTSGWCLWVRANGGAATIDPNLAETIDGSGALVIPDGQQALIVCDGSNFFTEFTTGQIAGRQTIASAATTDLATLQASYVQVTGTITITALGTLPAGRVVVLQFAGALTLTHNATSLILPNARDIATGAGDVAIIVSEGSGNWRCSSYQRTGKAAPTKVSFITASGTFTPDLRMIDCLVEGCGGL